METARRRFASDGAIAATLDEIRRDADVSVGALYQLDSDTTVVRFDVPGTGGSATSLAPYGFPYLAWVLGRLLSELGIGVVDVLGLSWGGALAQQFAFRTRAGAAA